MYDGAAIAMALLFAAVFLAVVAIAGLVRFDDPVRRRLAGEAPRRSDKSHVGIALSLRNDVVRPRRSWSPADPFNNLAFDGQWRIGQGVRKRLIQAGIADPRTARAYILAQFVLGIGAPVTIFFLTPEVLAALAPWQAAVLLGASAFGGFVSPAFWLTRRIKRRQRSIADSFPDALDMMVVCVEAGLGLDAALARVGTQISAAHPLLAAELDRMTLELRAGKGRSDALRNFAARIALPEIASFVTLLVQSEALGASIAQTLRVHADDMRANRLLRAEEMAHKLPVKLTVPLVICILPAMLVAVLLPGMLIIVRHVLPNLGQ
ncbi:MAG: type II secretion system F family protein [Alphaproteobacteria bacterium]